VADTRKGRISRGSPSFFARRVVRGPPRASARLENTASAKNGIELEADPTLLDEVKERPRFTYAAQRTLGLARRFLVQHSLNEIANRIADGIAIVATRIALKWEGILPPVAPAPIEIDRQWRNPRSKPGEPNSTEPRPDQFTSRLEISVSHGTQTPHRKGAFLGTMTASIAKCVEARQCPSH
jgi:hypothetical protein